MTRISRIQDDRDATLVAEYVGSNNLDWIGAGAICLKQVAPAPICKPSVSV